MMILPLKRNNDPILREVMPRFDFQKPPADPVEVAKNLTETMLSHNGLGLAAPQVGLPYRVFVMATNPIFACFNPTIVDTSSEEIELDEGCLSFPGLLVPVKRPRTIKVRFFMPNGEGETHTWNDMTARIFQHELDHLEGRVIWDRLSRLKLAMARNKLKKKGRV
jgi:peptide deformylase